MGRPGAKLPSSRQRRRHRCEYRAERANRKRQQILSAAGGLFARLGFDAASTDALAAAASVSKPTLYRYFPAKEELLIAAMRSMSVEATLVRETMSLPPNATRDVLEQHLNDLARSILDHNFVAEYIAHGAPLRRLEPQG